MVLVRVRGLDDDVYRYAQNHAGERGQLAVND
jgi:hypothetical protein